MIPENRKPIILAALAGFFGLVWLVALIVNFRRAGRIARAEEEVLLATAEAIRAGRYPHNPDNSDAQ